MSPLWTGEAIAAATGGRPVGGLPGAVTGVSIDTRTLEPGDAFFAIKGDRFDGHDYATAALAAGASLLVVSEARLPSLGRLNIPIIVAPDVLAALGRLGGAARQRSAAKVVAVTGSVGKTTTKEALRHVLAAVGKVHAARQSFNNHWGVPLTLARMPADCEFAVFEIGMNHPGEIRPLVRLVRPHVAIVTLIAAAHLGFFRSLDEIAEAKAEIFEAVEPGGHALINRDDRRWPLLKKLARAAGVANILGFGQDERADYRLVGCDLGPESSAITVDLHGRQVSAIAGAPGRHIVQNLLAVLGAADLVGADLDKAAGALATFRAEAGRGRRHRLAVAGGEATLIDESYNANPASMRAAMALLAAAPVGEKGRRIAVLGDMLELGDKSAKLHADLAPVVERTRADLVLLAGPEMKALAAKLPAGCEAEHRDSAAELEPLLMEALAAGDAVMIKSSKGIGFSRLVDALVKNFPAVSGPDKP